MPSNFFRIQNCHDTDFEFLCPKTWEALKPAFWAGVRQCDQCQRKVYLCDSDKDIALYSSLNYCIAVPTEPEGSAPSVKEIETPVPSKKSHFIGIYRKTNPDGTWATPVEWGDVPNFLRKYEKDR
jgi:hypothetical protein